MKIFDLFGTGVMGRRAYRAVIVAAAMLLILRLPADSEASSPPPPGWQVYEAWMDMIPYHIELLDHPLASERKRAIAGLMVVRNDIGDALPTLIEMSKNDDDPSVRSLCAALLMTMQEEVSESIPKLLSNLDSEDIAVLKMSAGLLGHLGDEAADAIERLIPLARNEDEEMRHIAIEAISRISQDPSLVLPIAQRGLEDDSFEVRRQSVIAIGRLGDAGADQIPQLVSILREAIRASDELVAKARPTPDEREFIGGGAFVQNETIVMGATAARALGGIGDRADQVIPILMEAAKERKSSDFGEAYSMGTMQVEAALALGSFGRDAREAIPVLIDCLDDDTIAVRDGRAVPGYESFVPDTFSPYDRIHICHAAAYSLGQIGRPAIAPVIELIQEVAANTQPHSREDGARERWRGLQAGYYALGSMRDSAKETVPFLIGALSRDQERGEAMNALSVLGPAATDAVDPLINRREAVVEKGWGEYEFRQITEVLIAIRPREESLDELLRLISDPDIKPEIRGEAVGLLSLMDSEVGQWMSRVIDLIGDDQEPALVRKRALLLLRKFPEQAGAGVDALVASLGRKETEDKNGMMDPQFTSIQSFEIETIKTLGEIGPPAVAAVPALENLIIDSSEDNQYQARRTAKYVARALGKIVPEKADFYLGVAAVGGATSKTIPALLEVLEDDAQDRWHNTVSEAIKTITKRIPYSPYDYPGKEQGMYSHSDLDKVVVDLSLVAGVVKKRLDPTSRVECLQAISVITECGKEGNDAVPELLALLGGKDPEIFDRALGALGSVGDLETARSLHLVYEEGEMITKRKVARVIGRMASGKHEFTEVCMELARHEDQEIQGAGVAALANIASNHPTPEIEKLLWDVLADSSNSVKVSAIYGLRHFPNPTEEQLKTMRNYRLHADDKVEQAARSVYSELQGKEKQPRTISEIVQTRELGSMGFSFNLGLEFEKAGEATPELKAKLLKDLESKDRDLVFSAALYLMYLKPEYIEAYKMYYEFLDYQSSISHMPSFYPQMPSRRIPNIPGYLGCLLHAETANWALGEVMSFGPEHPEAVPLFVEGMNGEHPDMRVASVLALGNIGVMSPDVEEAFQEGLNDVSPWVRAASALMMAKHLTADDGSLAPLVEQIESAQAPVRRWLMRESWKLAEPDSDLIKPMESATSDEEVAAAASNALRQIDLKLESYTRPSELRL